MERQFFKLIIISNSHTSFNFLKFDNSMKNRQTCCIVQLWLNFFDFFQRNNFYFEAVRKYDETFLKANNYI